MTKEKNLKDEAKQPPKDSKRDTNLVYGEEL